MRIFYPIALIVLAATAMLSLIKLNVLNEKSIEFQRIYKNLQIESDTYLKSLTSLSIDYEGTDVLLISGDSLKFSDSPQQHLIFYFPEEECSSCVEENIFELLNLAKKTDLPRIYITTNPGNSYYMRMMARVQQNESVSFGFLIKSPPLKKNCYFMVSQSGIVSNTFYPEKGNNRSTKRYLKYIINMLNETL